MVTFHDIQVVLLDIEGTTTPVDFVYQTLFPYAALHLETFLSTSLTEDDREMLRQEYAAESAIDLPFWSESPLEYLRWLMAQDSKSRGLKSIQGKIWKRGYENGELRGEIYPDVAPAILRWKDAGKNICIYSSGSVQAQQLIFGYSSAGDLTPYLSGYFDTAVGGKREAQSYRTIIAQLNLLPTSVLFISDIAAELQAAREAGLAVCLSIRPGNTPQTGEWPSIRSFAELDLP